MTFTSTAIATTITAAATCFTFLSLYYGSYYHAAHNDNASNYNCYFQKFHFYLLTGCFLLYITMPQTATAARVSTINTVHHHDNTT